MAVIGDKVKRGMLPLVARNPALDKAVGEYALAQAEQYERDKAAGKNPPIPLRNRELLEQAANLVLHEELTWSHPDKMSIVKYPIMSERNEQSYYDKFTLHSDLQVQDKRYTGKRKVHFTDDNGAPQVRKSRLIDPYDAKIDKIDTLLDLQDALDNAGLTDRQREALDLVYFGDMTQEDAAAEMGLHKANVNAYISTALRKIREYMTKR